MNKNTSPHILLCDDQEDVLHALTLLLKAEGFTTTAVTSPAQALQQLRETPCDAALIDMNYTRDTTSGHEGLDLLAQLLAIEPGLPVVVMTAWGSIPLAVNALQRGARDFIEKPWENQRLLSVLRAQLALRQALRQNQRLQAENQLLRQATDHFLANAPSMQRIEQLIDRVAPTDVNVLITGENGTGKSLAARALHARSPRAARALITVNAGSLPAGLFESELFGHIKGAFTDAREERIGRFELADGGTLFLDEIGNVPLPQQAVLLRVLESGEFERVGASRTQRVDARIIAATNAPLDAAVAEGRFRQDLLYRLNTVHLHLPPLRERREDILPLAQHFLRRHCARHARPAIIFSPAAVAALERHAWPGNIRELDHAIQRAILFASGDTIGPADLALASTAASAPLEELPLEDVERLLIQKALARYGGNVTQAAQYLGISRSAMYRRIAKHTL